MIFYMKMNNHARKYFSSNISSLIFGQSGQVRSVRSFFGHIIRKKSHWKLSNRIGNASLTLSLKNCLSLFNSFKMSKRNSSEATQFFSQQDDNFSKSSRISLQATTEKVTMVYYLIYLIFNILLKG